LLRTAVALLVVPVLEVALCYASLALRDRLTLAPLSADARRPVETRGFSAAAADNGVDK
jgi:hypothetical protein